MDQLEIAFSDNAQSTKLIMYIFCCKVFINLFQKINDFNFTVQETILLATHPGNS